MAEPNSLEKADRIVNGRALRALRERQGLTLYEASSRVRRFGQAKSEAATGISVQRWQQMEKGSVRFTEEQIERLTEALDATPADFEVQRARIMGQPPRLQGVTGMGEREPRAFVIPAWGRPELGPDGWTIRHADHSDGGLDLRDLVSPAIGVTHLADDAMAGKADAGDPVIFDRSKRPKEGKGCVLETRDGELYPRLYAGMDDEHVFVRSLKAGKPVAFRRTDVKGVYAVRFWGD